MKITLDTQAKTISLDEALPLCEIMATLKKLFPEDWKEWKLIGPEKHTIERSTVIQDHQPFVFRPEPHDPPRITYDGTGDPLPIPFITTCNVGSLVN